MYQSFVGKEYLEHYASSIMNSLHILGVLSPRIVHYVTFNNDDWVLIWESRAIHACIICDSQSGAEYFVFTSSLSSAYLPNESLQFAIN